MKKNIKITQYMCVKHHLFAYATASTIGRLIWNCVDTVVVSCGAPNMLQFEYTLEYKYIYTVATE